MDRNTLTVMEAIGLCFREHRNVYAYSVGSLAFILQLVLFYSIIYKSPAQFKVFKHLVLLDNSLAFIFNIMCVVLQPTSDSKDGNIFLLFDGPFAHLSQPYNSALWMLFLAVMLSTVVVLPLQYVYRYFLICRKVAISSERFALMFLASVSVVFVHCILGGFIFSHNNDTKVRERFGRLLLADSYWADDLPVYTILDKSNSLVIAHFVFNNIIMIVSYSVVVFCSRRVLTELRRNIKNMSRTTRDANNQLSLVLFVQAAVPFFCLSFPVLLQVTLSIAGISVPNTAVFLTTFVAWAPVLVAFATLMIVTPYRQTVFFVLPTKPPFKCALPPLNILILLPESHTTTETKTYFLRRVHFSLYCLAK